jgi:hypothetical protein
VRTALLIAVVGFGGTTGIADLAGVTEGAASGGLNPVFVTDTSGVLRAYLLGRAHLLAEVPILAWCDRMPMQSRLKPADVAALIQQRAIHAVQQTCMTDGIVQTPSGPKRRLVVLGIALDSSSATVRSSASTGECQGVRETATLSGPSPWRLVSITVEPAPYGECIFITTPDRPQ